MATCELAAKQRDITTRSFTVCLLSLFLLCPFNRLFQMFDGVRQYYTGIEHKHSLTFHQRSLVESYYQPMWQTSVHRIAVARSALAPIPTLLSCCPTKATCKPGLASPVFTAFPHCRRGVAGSSFIEAHIHTLFHVWAYLNGSECVWAAPVCTSDHHHSGIKA